MAYPTPDLTTFHGLEKRVGSDKVDGKFENVTCQGGCLGCSAIDAALGTMAYPVEKNPFTLTRGTRLSRATQEAVVRPILAANGEVSVNGSDCTGETRNLLGAKVCHATVSVVTQPEFAIDSMTTNVDVQPQSA